MFVTLDQLKLVRLVCRKCKSAIEIPWTNRHVMRAMQKCSNCGESFTDPTDVFYGALIDLHRAMSQLDVCKDNVEVSFGS